MTGSDSAAHDLEPMGHAVYAAAVIARAKSDLGLREAPGQRNRGPRIDAMLANVGLPPGVAWCAAAAYTWHLEAAATLGGRTTCPRTGGATAMWIRARRLGSGALTYHAADVLAGLIYPEPGDLYVRVRTGRGARDVPQVLAGHRTHGHVGLVVGLDEDGAVHCIDGNTNPEGSREGDGVYHRRFRPQDMPELVGFVRPGLLVA